MKTTGGLTRTLQELNRAVPRVQLRAHAHAIERGDVQMTPPVELDADALRVEVAALSTFFIEALWRNLESYLHGLGALLARPAPSGTGFVPVDVVTAEDPVADVGACIEALLVSFGRYTEHVLARTADGPAAAAHRRYQQLVACLPPAGTHTPTSHGAGNALAGMQLTLALAEVLPRTHELRRGAPITADALDAILASPAFEQLVSTIGASSARVSNALLATLAPVRFPVWSHALLALAPAERGSRRLALAPEVFELVEEPHGMRLDLTAEALARFRETARALEIPGRSHQVACPAFAALTPDAHVFGAFTRWLVEVIRRHLAPRLL